MIRGTRLEFSTLGGCNPREDRHFSVAPSMVIALCAASLAFAACTKDEHAPHEGTDKQHAPSPQQPANEPAAAAAPTARDFDPAKEAERIEGQVHFVEPKDGASVRGKLTEGKVAVPAKMAVEGMKVQPAGEPAAATGHHHIIVGGDSFPVGQVIPNDATHLHFGKGQTETILNLAPGKHKLTMQFADGLHRSYGPKWSASININVEAEEASAEH
ncbi:MAG: DUF4399 domain-containing protein [Proteobacteria bacterium]|nr:DUF4399 domain-containing protein [Pseudomonadota bacterium]